jgi:drug/metabolite transporter (DMT)-like permease
MSFHIKPIEDRRLLGISLIMLAVLCFTLIDTSAKWLVSSGMPTLEVVFVRYLGQLAIFSVLLVTSRARELLVTRSPALTILRGLILLAATVFNFFAVKYLPLTVTGSIVFALPLVLCALSVPLLGEHVGWRRWLAILVGFGGVLIIIRPTAGDFNWAIFFSLGAVTCYAFYNIVTRKLAGVDSPHSQQFYAALVATVCIMPFAFGEWVWPSDPASWLAFFTMGVMGAVGHQIYTIAHRLGPASTLAPFVYVQIIYMTSASWIVFDEPPDRWIFLGAPIVIASGLYIWLRERQLQGKE